MTKVRNINRTSWRKPRNHASWKNWWEYYTKRSFRDCSCEGCKSPAIVGAHVQQPGSDTTKEWYIVPLCNSCNKKKTAFFVRDYDLVSLYDRCDDEDDSWW